MFALVLTLHLIICVALITVVLVQSGKGGGLAGGAFGGSAQTVFGGRGATDFFTRATMVLAGVFFLTSLTLALLSAGRGGSNRSLLQEEARRAATSQPAQVPAGGAPSSPAGGTAPAPAGGTAPAPAAGQVPATGGGSAPQGSGR